MASFSSDIAPCCPDAGTPIGIVWKQATTTTSPLSGASKRFTKVTGATSPVSSARGAATRKAMQIVEGGLDDPRVIELLHIHLTRARAETAPGSAHALDLSGLRSSDVTFWSAWEGDRLAGVGALKQLSADHGEVKSMHTAESMRRRGIGAAILRHIIDAARARGMSRLSLETGSWPYFAPARALYARHGFVECPPFGDYVADRNSVFMTIVLPSA